MYNQNYIKVKITQAINRVVPKNMPKENSKLPPGQFETAQFPILDLGERPPLGLHEFKLTVFGDINKEPFTLTFEDLLKMNPQKITADFHCVTRWSRLGLSWTGVPFYKIAEIAQLKETARYVIFGSRDGYTTNVPLEDCLKENVIAAFQLEGQEIPLMHGGPVRMIIPHLYGWKSAKFLESVKFSEQDEPGFWEIRGYHPYGDPWKEQRYT